MKWSEAMEKLSETAVVTKRELVLGALSCALAGMVAGMLAVKMTTGWSLNLCSGNGSNNQNNGSGNKEMGLPPHPPKEHRGGEMKCRKKKHKESECTKNKEMEVL